jgi:activator of 2-hydroxyglutaryl-CoA dehydratase/predicted nucleotide-binding protein (sugar kinase/HSP70/actin superfamily)
MGRTVVMESSVHPAGSMRLDGETDRSNGRPLHRFVGLDVGAETVKLIEVSRYPDGLRVSRRALLEHGKKPGPVLIDALQSWDWQTVRGATVTGRFASQVGLLRIPTKQAQIRGYQSHFGEQPATLVNIGSHGFSVLELLPNGLTRFRDNSRCSQGTGNFLRQLVERFSLTVEEAGVLCADVRDPAPLSGRCPVILKTDMTHLANKGEDRARILAGLFDAVCENVFVLIKPGACPPRVLLTGGVSRSPRVRRVFAELLARHGMDLITIAADDSLYLEALGGALVAAETPADLPALNDLVLPPPPLKLERLPPLGDALNRVQRMPRRPWAEVHHPGSPPGITANNGRPSRLVLGFDIGSTGSKLVAIDSMKQQPVWESYRQTLGDPVGAAQDLLDRFHESPVAGCTVVAFGVTGSGREVTGSLLTSCYGKDAVFVINEIVAHAAGALHYSPRVDTIFEIGGQDAKYIRLAEGRIIECAMNEACSAGTGSFIEEQGRKFAGMEDVRQLGQAALAAPWGVSLGQHCSVFMAEVIDEAVAAGVEQPAILSGLYDSIIKNYLNRVKGNRSIGKVIFCQGMPFAADALAAAVARQTGSEVIVPPNPGTVGALGIALLASRELAVAALPSLDSTRFRTAKLEEKDTFVCRSTRGCGGSGNRCRIERLRTLVCHESASFTWGGACSLHDKGTRKKKLPDLAPDPFRQREERLQQLVQPLTLQRGKPRIAISDEFMLKGLFPFFTTFLHEAGFDLQLVTVTDSGSATLKRGIQSANVPFCAPLQFFNGLAERMAETGADWLFIPMIRSLPRAAHQHGSVVCPVVQATPDMLRWTVARENGHEVGSLPSLGPNGRHGLHNTAPGPFATGVAGRSSPFARQLSPIINFSGGNLESKEFLDSCQRLARELGVSRSQWRKAWKKGVAAQQDFDTACLEIGQRALDYCHAQDLVPVVVLGRNYTIYNKVLNSNVPAILREQGAIGIPVDCCPVDPDVPLFPDMYWGYGQHLLRVAHQVRRTPGVYALYCSNYSCGPDSFNLHFVGYVMEGKPFAILETDGHSGDAGTRTRVEAFLHCVDEDRQVERTGIPINDFASVQLQGLRLIDLQRNEAIPERTLLPYMGPASESMAAILRGLGLEAEALPEPDDESLRQGRRHTSGKECLPMTLTLGSLLQRLQRADGDDRFLYLMPKTEGPCRFGVYNLLNQIVLQRLGWNNRVRIWSPADLNYFEGFSAGAELLIYSSTLAEDFLLRALLDVRPVERERGAAEALYARFHAELVAQLESVARGDLSLASALWQVFNGRLFGIPQLLERAGAALAAQRQPTPLPRVGLLGEIYVRSVPFSNDSIIAKLEARGLRVHPPPMSEWLAYCGHVGRQRNDRSGAFDGFKERVRHRIEEVARTAMAPHFDWPQSFSVTDSLAAAGPYINSALEGEAVLTIGRSLCEWRHGQIDAVVNIGPLECMPTKIAEAQFHPVAEREGLLSLTLAFHGDPVSTSALDNFAFEVHSRFQRRRTDSPRTLHRPVLVNPLQTAHPSFRAAL